ncbi:MAG: putative capsid protein [Circoviridae sp.]|nr:MAG: putative capsid protein [Circoviridae sp.]
MSSRKPRKMSRRPRGLTKTQASSVKKIARAQTLALAETINKVNIVENTQLFHNKVLYVGNLLATDQGVADDNSQSNKDVRKGDEILLKNMNIRFWLSNKLDRPNVMYKGVLFWYKSELTLTDAVVYFTQTNKMLDRYNSESIRVIDQFILKSTNNYAVDANNHEHSYLATLNKSYKGKRIKYEENTPTTKGWDMGFALVCYDAFGTLQTDNISSVAYNIKLSFKDL